MVREHINILDISSYAPPVLRKRKVHTDGQYYHILTKAYNQYIKKLVLLHEMLVYSMKSKQTTDLANVEKLKSLPAEFRAVYFGKHSRSGHKH